VQKLQGLRLIRISAGHHIHWLSRGGEDALENPVLIDPTHHATVHQRDAIFDYADLSFRFLNGLIEPLRINEDLSLAAWREAWNRGQ
jgi:hypothetical protein